MKSCKIEDAVRIQNLFEGSLHTLSSVTRETGDINGLPLTKIFFVGSLHTLSGSTFARAPSQISNWSQRRSHRSGKFSLSLRLFFVYSLDSILLFDTFTNHWGNTSARLAEV